MINAKENCSPNPQKIIFLSTRDLLLESKNEILNNTIIPKMPVYCSIVYMLGGSKQLLQRASYVSVSPITTC